MKKLILPLSVFSALLTLALATNVQAQVKVINAPASYEFRDMGYDSTTGQVGIVGYDVAGATKTAKVFGINATNDGFTATTLVGLGTGTQVFGISSDATRIAGISKSPGSINAGEGTTWLRSNLSSPVGIGYVAGLCANTSNAVSAWKDGVVGQCGGGAQSIKWTQATGSVALGGHTGSVGEAKDVSSNGSITVGYAGGAVCQGNACYWDSTGIHKLQDPFNVESTAYSISPNGSYIGGYVSEDVGLDNYINAAVWDANRNLILLKDSNGNRFQGIVLDVSDSGYAVGTTSDNKGFIWHPSFDGIKSPYKGAQIFDTWLATIPNGAVLASPSKGVEAVAEDKVNSKLIFALSAYEAPGRSAFVSAVVAGVGGGDVPTHVGTENNDTFNITLTAVNQRVYVKGLGGNDIINITGNANGGNVKVEAGAGNDTINVRSDKSDFKSYIYAGDGANTVNITSYNGINFKAVVELGEGIDKYSTYLQSAKGAVIGVKAKGGNDIITSTNKSGQGVVLAYDLGDGTDSVNSTSTLSTDLNLAINASLGNNTITLNSGSGLVNQGLVIGNGTNILKDTLTTVAPGSISAYDLGTGSNKYTGTFSSSNNATVTICEPRLAAGVSNNLSNTIMNTGKNVAVNFISPNITNVSFTSGSVGYTYKKYSSMPSGMNAGTQVYNQIVNTFNPYN